MALIALCLWVVVAWVAMVVLTGRRTWWAAGALAPAGVAIGVWLGLSMGWGWALLGAVVLGLVLRWPLRHAGRWLLRAVGPR